LKTKRDGAVWLIFIIQIRHHRLPIIAHAHFSSRDEDGGHYSIRHSR